jgi:hypothetical protein
LRVYQGQEDNLFMIIPRLKMPLKRRIRNLKKKHNLQKHQITRSKLLLSKVLKIV